MQGWTNETEPWLNVWFLRSFICLYLENEQETGNSYIFFLKN